MRRLVKSFHARVVHNFPSHVLVREDVAFRGLPRSPPKPAEAMFFKSAKPDPGHESELRQVVDRALPDSDDETRRVVVAVAGLLGCVAYADRNFSASEQSLVLSLLQTIHGIQDRQAAAIVDVLDRSVVHVATVEAPRHARTLMELGDRDLRLHVLDLLLQVAAADQEIHQNEVVFLRGITQSLGLEQADYNELQSRHRDKLSSLKK